jgi:aspartyl-tRNA(Asn)/glutamyl-tRNA(Gln) amidotransferase subunit A
MRLRTIAGASDLVRKKEISPTELTRECLEQIERLNPSLNAFITVTAKSALAEAQQAEHEISAGNWRGPLHGIPVGLKDLIDTAGVRTTAGSAFFRHRVPTEDAEVVKNLKAAGAVLIGKQNLHEFAYGGSSLISHYGPVRNPINPDFIAGGSSGGSAAAVACGMCYASIGTDTAGSIREPAALCGVVGLKPSYQLVNKRGIIPLSPSLDCVGPIARSVEDSAILLDAITDRSASCQKALTDGKSNLVLGVPRKFFFEDLDQGVGAAVQCALDQLTALVGEAREVEIPVKQDRTLQSYESYNFHREMVGCSPELYNPETLRRIRTGEKITEAQYRAALGELEKERTEIARIFQEIDILVMPTTPIPAPRISDLVKDPSLLRPAELVLLRNTRPVNVWGLPAISLPCGLTVNGLPTGLQIIGPPGGEKKVLQTAFSYERSRNLLSRLIFNLPSGHLPAAS